MHELLLLLWLLLVTCFVEGIEGQEVSQLSLKQPINSLLVLLDEGLLHETILRVLDQLPETYH